MQLIILPLAILHSVVRKQCALIVVVYWCNAIPKDTSLVSVALAYMIHAYQVFLKGNEIMPLVSERMLGHYRVEVPI